MLSTKAQNTRLRRVGLLGAILAFFSFASMETAQAAIHTASPGGNTIGQCITAAASGDTVEIEAGVYNETVLVNKALALVGLSGSGSTTITGPDSGVDALSIMVDGVDISGLTIDGGQYGITIDAGVTQIQFSDCVVSESTYSHLNLPPSLVAQVVSSVTLVPHASGQHNSVRIMTGTITESMTWPTLPSGIVYHLNYTTVTVGGPTSPVLTIASGTIIKNYRSGFLIGQDAGNPGGLMADNVVFTSLYDNSVGGDTPGSITEPAASHWYYIRFYAGAIPGSCQLTNCDIRYGGRDYGVLWARYGGSFTATDCALETNGQSVRIEGGAVPTITNCTMAPQSNGISVYEPSSSDGITNCTITQDSGYPAVLPMNKVDSFLNVQGNSYIARGDGLWNAIAITNTTITESTTLPILPDSFGYYLNYATVTVGGPASPVLTIPAGTFIKNYRSGFLIGQDAENPGGLMADNVTFTSIFDDSTGGNTSGNTTAPAASQWYYLRFYAGAIPGSCQLTNCDIRYGGRDYAALWARYGGSFTATDCALESNRQSIRIEGGGTPTITNCTLAPQSTGISVYEPSSSDGITNCTITQGDGYPAFLPMASVDSFLNVQGNSYIARGDGKWDAMGINNSTITESMALPVLPDSFGYYLYYATVTVGGPNSPVLTIPSGTFIKNYRSGFLIGQDAGNPGGLMADNVTFTSIYDNTVGGNTSGNTTAPAASQWYYLRFYAGAIPGSCQLTNCDIRYGGRDYAALWARYGGSFTATDCALESNRQSIRIEGGGTPTITNCTLAPQSTGISVYEPSSSEGITGCTITQGDGYPAFLPMASVDSFLNVQGNSYIARGDGKWDAMGINNSTITETMTLPVLPDSFGYYLYYATVSIGGPNSPVLTIVSGTIIKNYRSGFLIGPDADNPGGLMADNVVFTSLYDDTVGGDTSGNTTAPAASHWYYLRFYAGSIPGSCQLTNCAIRYGGRDYPALWARYGGSFTATDCTLESNTQSIRVEGGGEPTITNCTIAPANSGMLVYEPSTGSGITNCTITQGAGYPAYLPLASVDSFLNAQGNSYIPRGDSMYDAIVINNSTITESMTVPVLPHDFVYYPYYARVNVGGPSRPTLTILPGTIFKSYRSSFVMGQGTGNPGGIHAEGVTFTSLYDDTVGGDTSGNSTAPTAGNWQYLQFNSTSYEHNCKLLDCDLRYGGRDGYGTIYVRPESSLVLNSVRISQSSSAAVNATGLDSRPRIYYCEFFDNYDGIRSTANARPYVIRSCFENNSHFSVTAAEFTDGEGDLLMQECWWGDASGPVVGTDVSEFVDYSNWTTVATCTEPSDVPVLPTVFSAQAPAPNPFNPSTEIRFALPSSESVRLRIFDVRGGLVRELVSGESYPAGNFSVTWNGRDNAGRSVPSGVYFYALEAGQHRANQKMMVLK